MIHRPSDTSISQADYANGIGFYTDVTRFSNLLSIPEFDDSSYPTEGHVGELIRYAEDYIDEYTKDSWRPILVENEYHESVYIASKLIQPLENSIQKGLDADSGTWTAYKELNLIKVISQPRKYI